jgi:hypothetical protein
MSSPTQDQSIADGVYTYPTEHPRGWKTARFTDGSVREARWFPSYTQAKAYAVELHAADLNRMLGERRA